MKKLLTVLIILGVLFGLYKILSSNPSDTGASFDSAELVIFWGNGCPHCETVKKFILDNKIETSIKIAYKEVYYNKSNQQLLEDTAKKCPEIDSSQGIGVPFGLVKTTGKCLYGDKPIIDWLQTKMIK